MHTIKAIVGIAHPTTTTDLEFATGIMKSKIQTKKAKIMRMGGLE